MYDPNPPPPLAPWEQRDLAPPPTPSMDEMVLTPEQMDYYGDWVANVDILASQMNPGGGKHRVNIPSPTVVPPHNTDPGTGGGTGEFTGGRGSSRPLGSGMAKRPMQAQQGRSRPPGQFQKVQAQPRHVLRQQTLQRPRGMSKIGAANRAKYSKH